MLAEKEKGMKDSQGRTALYHSHDKECADFLWKFPEERDMNNLWEVKEEYNIPRVSCNDGTCPKAVSLLDATRLGCIQCVQKHID